MTPCDPKGVFADQRAELAPYLKTCPTSATASCTCQEYGGCTTALWRVRPAAHRASW